MIDAGYRGEILVLMTNLGETAVELKAGEKIAQMIPVPVLTGDVAEVESLEDSARAEKGFGSSGRVSISRWIFARSAGDECDWDQDWASPMSESDGLA